MNGEEKIQALRQIAEKIAATNGGPLCGVGVNSVPGEGDPKAKLMFIGEAPGFFENKLGRPFVGRSGRLLRKTIKENGINENKVYITNIVKYRPPENRDPTPEEIEFFKPFLDRQIKIIQPKIIVTLGRFSMYKFLGNGVSISRIHGQSKKMTWYDKEIIVFPMYHPSAALRNGSVFRQFVEDFKKLKDLALSENIPLE